MNHRTLSALGLSLFPLVIACATVPITGRTQLMLVSDETLARASADAYSTLVVGAEQQGIGVLAASDSPEAAALLRTVAIVANRVIASAGLEGWRPWEVVILKSSTRNAFVMPHGKIVIFSGLLETTQNEAQLAAVIGHEVAHLVARHAAERLSQMLAAQAALTVADAILANSEYRPLIGTALGLGMQFGLLLPYNRNHESEADHIGLFYMAKAGYDPSEAITLLESMEASNNPGTLRANVRETPGLLSSL